MKSVLNCVSMVGYAWISCFLQKWTHNSSFKSRYHCRLCTLVWGYARDPLIHWWGLRCTPHKVTSFIFGSFADLELKHYLCVEIGFTGHLRVYRPPTGLPPTYGFWRQWTLLLYITVDPSRNSTEMYLSKLCKMYVCIMCTCVCACVCKMKNHHFKVNNTQ